MRLALLSPSDAPAYRGLMLHAYAEAADAFTSTPEERAAEPASWWVQRIGGPGALTAAFGAFRGEALVGSVALVFSSKPKTRHKAELIGMYVQRDERGAGLGRALLDEALRFVQARGGIRSVVLTVTQGNDAAVALYAQAGFQVFGTEPLAILTPGGFKAKLHLCKCLPAPA